MGCSKESSSAMTRAIARGLDVPMALTTNCNTYGPGMSGVNVGLTVSAPRKVTWLPVGLDTNDQA